MEKMSLEDKIMEIASMADQIGTIAFCAANVSFDPDKCEMVLDDVLSGIENLCKKLSDDLITLNNSLGELGRVVV